MSKDYQPSLTEGVIRLLYSALYVIVLPISFLILLIKLLTRKPGYDKRRLERYGHVPAPEKTGGILIHCVSVGEVVAASKLIQQILRDAPDTPITITTTTVTGSQRVRQIFADRVHHFYLPFDLHMFMKGMLCKVQPQKVLITEVELWPNLVHACWSKKIPVFVINARMTEKSARNYARIGLLFNPMLQKLTRVCAQGQRDADNYLSLGLSADKLVLTRNIKFDIDPVVDNAECHSLVEKYNPQRRPLMIGASTHAPEEQVLIDAYGQLAQDHPALQLLIVPRHPQRFDKVWQMLSNSGLRVCKSSESIDPNADLVLVDEMGVLSKLYAIADLAFIGGSIADKGGHNALEAALYGVPVVMGRFTYNNPEICKVLEQSGGLVLTDNAHQIALQVHQWLNNSDVRIAAGEAGKQVLDSNRGAIDLTINLLAQD